MMGFGNMALIAVKCVKCSNKTEDVFKEGSAEYVI